jgi:heme oxygenase (mycobilin-producing)
MSVIHFRADDAGFEHRGRQALTILAACRGFTRASLNRSTDDPDDWVLVTEWENVGSYRRALGSYDVKVHLTPVLGQALDLPSSFESLVVAAAGGETTTHASDRA